MITPQAIKAAADRIGCKTAAVKAVIEVESNGNGFLSTGEPIILFEPHIFWKQLRFIDIVPVTSDICYATWGTKPYGKSSIQHAKLAKASLINRDAALKSASWGLFQIMGFNYELCGCNTLQEFINKMYKSEDAQLELFINYILHSKLDDELRNEDWKSFARQYNGPLYYKNSYDIKLKKAFTKYS